MKRSALPAVLILAVAGCTLPIATTPPLETTASRPAIATAAIQGTLSVPAALLTSHGGLAGIVSNNSGGLISNNGGGLISLTKYALAAVDESAQAGVQLYLADASGAPLKGLAASTSGADGRFAFSSVPPNFTVVVVAALSFKDGTSVKLKTLARTGAQTAAADVDMATTFLTTALVSQQGQLPGAFDAQTFASSAALARNQLTASDVAALGDNAAMAARVATLESQNAALKAQVGQLQADLATAQATIGQLETQIAASPAPTAPAPSTSASASVPTAPPSPGAQATPTASPTAPSTPTAPPTPAPTTTPKTVAFTTITTIAGSGAKGLKDGVGTAAEFQRPQGLAFAPNGNLYIADSGNGAIRVMTPDFHVTTLAGGAGLGYADGAGASAKFSAMSAIAFDPAGDLLVADTDNNCIRKVTPAGVVSTLAGATTAGYADGPGTNARFNSPHGLAVDGAGDVFVADYNNQCIRKIDPQGNVTTFAGATTPGYQDGAGTAARFRYPTGLCADAAGNLYVADDHDFVIRKITPGGQVSTYAGKYVASATSGGFADGAAASALFSWTGALGIGADGVLYVPDGGNARIRTVSADGSRVATLVGNGTSGHLDGALAAAEVNYPRGLAFDAAGRLYVCDMNNNVIRMLQ